MGTYGKGMTAVGSQLTDEKAAYLDARIARFNGTRSSAITTIYDMWLALGAPPLNLADSYMPVLPVPDKCRVTLQPYWTGLVAFDASDGKPEKDSTLKSEVERLTAPRRRKAVKAARGESTPPAPRGA